MGISQDGPALDRKMDTGKANQSHVPRFPPEVPGLRTFARIAGILFGDPFEKHLNTLTP